MKFTNKHDLPDYLRLWLKYDDYDYLEGIISATGLLSSVRQTLLKQRHFDDMEVDVSEFIARRIGTAIHASFEEVEMPRITKEKRVICEIAGRKISGKYDMLKDIGHGKHRIIDIKTTGVGSYIYGSSLEEWKCQLSIYRYILEHDGWEIVDGEMVDRKAIKVDNFAEICLAFTDWNRGRAMTQANYPKLKVGNMSTTLFAEDVIESFIIERLEGLEAAEKLDDDDLPLCDDEELWKDADKWAVLKEGNVKPKLFDTEEAAKIFAEHTASSSGRSCSIEHREGLVKACNYCDPRYVCNQYPQMLDKGLIQVIE